MRRRRIKLGNGANQPGWVRFCHASPSLAGFQAYDCFWMDGVRWAVEGEDATETAMHEAVDVEGDWSWDNVPFRRAIEISDAHAQTMVEGLYEVRAKLAKAVLEQLAPVASMADAWALSAEESHK